MMATYASGTSNSGVVRAISREAQEGYFDGTTTMVIFFASVEKKVDDKHSINISGFTPTRGKLTQYR
jgi:hypothetical protein